MPIEQLLALYRSSVPESLQTNSNLATESTNDDENVKTNESKTTAAQPTAITSESTSQLDDDGDKLSEQTLIDRIEPASSNLSKLISTSEDALYDISDDEEEDEDDFTPEDNWRRTIQIGLDYQATVPDNPILINEIEKAEADVEKKIEEEIVKEDKNSDEKMIDSTTIDLSIENGNNCLLLWNPKQLNEKQVKTYLKNFINNDQLNCVSNSTDLIDSNKLTSSTTSSSSSATASSKSKINEISSTNAQLDNLNQQRDDELALYVLLKNCYEIETTLSNRNKLDQKFLDLFTFIKRWSDADCDEFEDGLRLYGKDFHQIQKNKLTHKSVNELVNFYYLWKKTERHDTFTSKFRFEKKKYQLNPNTTDLMDHFLDDHPTNQTSFNSTSSSLNNSHNNSMHTHFKHHHVSSSLTLLPNSNHLANHLPLAVHHNLIEIDENSNQSSGGQSSNLIINEVVNEANSNEDDQQLLTSTTAIKTTADDLKQTNSSGIDCPDSSTVQSIDSSSSLVNVTSSTNL